MIQYDDTIPLVEHFGMYQVPDTMADAVEQYRIDSLRSVMETLHVGTEIFELLVTEDDSKTDDFKIESIFEKFISHLSQQLKEINIVDYLCSITYVRFSKNNENNFLGFWNFYIIPINLGNRVHIGEWITSY